MPLNLETRLTLDDKVVDAENLTSRFTQRDLDALGEWVHAGYERDLKSREKWQKRYQAAMDLALQLQKEKNFPWPGAANVAFPLVTIAALQFHSRAYPALISGTDIVKYRVPSPDPQGVAKAKADRVGRYMSYQVLEEDQGWEEQHDRLLIQLPIIGTVFVKTRHVPSEGKNVSETVSAFNLVIDYHAKSVEESARKTQILFFYRNEVHEKCKGGIWKDITQEEWYHSAQTPPTPTSDLADVRTGLTPGGDSDENTPLQFLEQHTWVDFDKDGYAEPYIITIETTQRRVVRIVARWDAKEDIERLPNGEILRIRATEHYTKYGLIPSPDGSIYDLGFGILLGPLNETVNTLVNQLLDAGTMQTAGGGFLGRGVRMRGGEFRFRPFGWQRIESSGDDIKKNVFALPVPDPSDVLFKLLSFIVNYVQRISGSTDMLAGENPGQNTPAETTREMVNQGMKIYNALFKRQWRSMKEEFRKLYILNTRFMAESKNFGAGKISRDDFKGDPSQICPSADPNITSDVMKLQQAMAIADRAQVISGYDVDAAERNLLSAMRVEGAELLFVGSKNVPPKIDPKVQLEQMKQKGKILELQAKQQQFVADLIEERRVNNAQIILLMAQAEKFHADAEAAGTDKILNIIDINLQHLIARNEALQGQIQLGIDQQAADTATQEAQTNEYVAHHPPPVARPAASK